MNSSTMRLIGVLVAVALVFGGCRERAEQEAVDGVTETIAPAEPQPAPTGTEAMTQTVNIEEGRSEAEGGLLPPTGREALSTAPEERRETSTAVPLPPNPPPPNP